MTDPGRTEGWAGFNVRLIAVTAGERLLHPVPAEPHCNQDRGRVGHWPRQAGYRTGLGNNGRAVIEPLFDGRDYGPGSTDYGDYNSSGDERAVDKALSASSVADATKDWQDAAKLAMQDAVIVPHSLHLRQSENCDVTNVWLSGS
jgi:hypothetical protein